MSMSFLVPAHKGASSLSLAEVGGFLRRLIMRSLSLSSVQVGELSRLCLILGLTFIPGVMGQYEYKTHTLQTYDCDRFCFETCDKYFGKEYSDCVSANVYCACMTRVTMRKPNGIFVVVGFIAFLVSMCCFCCFKKSNNTNSGSRQRPVGLIATQPVPNNGRVTGTRSRSLQPPGSSRVNPSRSSQTSPRPFIVDLREGLKPNDLPPEYLPPPAYNDCVFTVDSRGPQRF